MAKRGIGRGRVPRAKMQRVKRKLQYGGRRIKQPVQYFTRTLYRPGYVGLTPGNPASGQAVNFQLSSVPDFTEFTNLYDQYQIKAVKVSYIPRFTEAGNQTAQNIGNMWSVIDYDDSNVPPNLNTLLQYQNIKRTQMNKIHTRYLKPMVATEAFATGIASTYAPKRNVWLDATTAATEHYGIKLWFDQIVAGSSPIVFDQVIKFYLAFKNVR